MAIAAVVLAGGARDAVARLDPTAANKSFVRVGGEALVARTIAALRCTPSVGRIVVVAPFEPQALAMLAGADEIRRDGARITDSLRAGLRGLPADDLVLVCASDLPILSASAVEEFLELAQRSQADAVYACVERATHLARFPQVPHTWARLREGTFCGGGCVALRPRVFIALERFLERLGAARKNPLLLAHIFGYEVLTRYAFGLLSIAEVERRGSRLLGAPVAAAICSHAEIAVNVDRASDVELAKTLV